MRILASSISRSLCTNSDATAAGRGAWTILLLGALKLIENQFAMLLECAEAFFERKEHRLRHLCLLTGVKRVLDDRTLANDLDLQFGDVPVSLGKMPLFLSAIHGFAPTTDTFEV